VSMDNDSCHDCTLIKLRILGNLATVDF
ncbi:hypothetical protein A2U01_0097709, partial [Trifolium medium]|nr:hypothetical protein [Trifolium medium]